VDSVVGYNKTETPTFVLSAGTEDRVRFAFCRSLYEVLIAPNREPAIVTKSKTQRQKANRAFAAEFLLPSATLRNRITEEEVEPEMIEDLANEFGVSSMVVQHQLANHKIAVPTHSFDLIDW
jgi:hypothetical protein